MKLNKIDLTLTIQFSTHNQHTYIYDKKNYPTIRSKREPQTPR
jgi:hypothetical protein